MLTLHTRCYSAQTRCVKDNFLTLTECDTLAIQVLLMRHFGGSHHASMIAHQWSVTSTMMLVQQFICCSYLLLPALNGLA